jgi:hypothetical protein
MYYYFYTYSKIVNFLRFGVMIMSKKGHYEVDITSNQKVWVEKQKKTQKKPAVIIEKDIELEEVTRKQEKMLDTRESTMHKDGFVKEQWKQNKKDFGRDKARNALLLPLCAIPAVAIGAGYTVLKSAEAAKDLLQAGVHTARSLHSDDEKHSERAAKKLDDAKKQGLKAAKPITRLAMLPVNGAVGLYKKAEKSAQPKPTYVNDISSNRAENSGRI